MSQRTLIASCLALGMIGRLEYKPIHDTDIFWQVKLGQIMLEEGRIPLEDRFTYTHAGEPTPPVGWLAQGLLASLYNLGGWRLTRLAHHFALIGALFTAVATCRRPVTTPFGAAVAMTIGFLVMLSNADLRPQSLALFSFAVLLAVARSDLPFRIKLAVAMPLLVGWQNMHPSVIVGAVAVAGLAAADFLDPGRYVTCCWQMPAMALLAFCGQFLTPLRAGVFGVARNNLRISRDVLHLAEWGPPWDPKVVAAVSPYWIALLGSVVAIVWFWRQIPTRDRALFIVMTILSLYAARFIIFWAIAIVPFWAMVVERIIPAETFAWARGDEDTPARYARATVCLFVAAVILLGVHSTQFSPIIEPEIPLEGVTALRAHLPGAARIYNDYVWAGPLILEGRERWRIAVDGRLYLFPDPAEWRSAADARSGKISVEELERVHDPDAFFLYRAHAKPLIEALLSCPRWRICYCGPTCVAFVRNP